MGYLYSKPIVQSHVALCQLPQLENFVHSLCICVFVKSRYKFNISKETSVDICVYELSIIPCICFVGYPILILTNESTSLASEDIIILGILTEHYDFA